MTHLAVSNLSLEEATNELMQKAFAHSAEAFSQFLGKKVTFDTCHKMSNEPVLTHLPFDEPLNLLISELRGDLRGTCYLIFSQDDTSQILKTQLSEAYQHNIELQDALLKELDNILTASFITVLANELSVSTYAYVPKLKRGNKMELFSFLKSDEIHLELNHKFKAIYLIEGVPIQPVFTWAFDSQINHFIGLWQEKEALRHPKKDNHK